MMGYCGLDCGRCPIHRATVEENETKKLAMRIDIARICKERYGLSVQASDINDCDGCRSGKLFATCAKCEIRRCARERKLEACAFCGKFSCERLNLFAAGEPAARARLERLRMNGLT
jgi:hypothetical protein